MKIFISHASANKDYGNVLVNLLRQIGISAEEIIFTSNVAYGIPIGQNIFNWLKSQINEKPFVIYLLSKEYYSSIACLNEMGAAWVIENKHAVVFTHSFDFTIKDFHNGALDPREIGFHYNDEDRLLAFIQQLSEFFNISKNNVIINQSVKHYLNQVKSLTIEKASNGMESTFITESIPKKEVETVSSKNSIYLKFISDIVSKNFKDEELILLHYIIDTGKVKLMTGWLENHEISSIIEWEDINQLNSKLSNNYNSVIKRFELRGYTEVSAVTGGGNTKEVILKPEIKSNILDLPLDVINIINSTLSINKKVNNGKINDLPF